jgi:hypothetical protein
MYIILIQFFVQTIYYRGDVYVKFSHKNNSGYIFLVQYFVITAQKSLSKFKT